MDIRNIYCVGRNYRMHALELGNDVPTFPMIFTKPTHAIEWMDGRTISIPKHKGNVHFELEIVVKIRDGYRSGMKAKDGIDSFTLGLDLTLRDVQSQIKAKGQPWLPAKGFRNSALLGNWQEIIELEELYRGEFTLHKNNELVQIGHASDMIFKLDDLIQFIDEQYGLGAGDIIFTGTPEGVGSLLAGDMLEANWNGASIGICIID